MSMKDDRLRCLGHSCIHLCKSNHLLLKLSCALLIIQCTSAFASTAPSESTLRLKRFQSQPPIQCHMNPLSRAFSNSHHSVTKLSAVNSCRGGGSSKSSSILESGNADIGEQWPATKGHHQLQLSVLTILLATSLNLLGFTMTSPLNPFLGQHFQLPVGMSFGSLTSAYPFGMLAGIILWPQLSDKIGRKPIIMLSLFGSGFGLLLQTLAIINGWSLKMFLTMRVITGSFAGAGPAIKSYLADISDKDALPLLLGWRDAASTLAYIIGPMLGGFIYESKKEGLFSKVLQSSASNSVSESVAFVIGLSAVASLLAAVLVGFIVDDKPRSSSRQTGQSISKEEDSDTNVLVEDDEIISCPLGMNLWSGVASVCVVSFLFNIADSTFHAFLPAFLLQNQFDASKIGMAFTAFACISFCVSVSSISSILIRQVGVVTTCAMGLSIVGMGLSGLAITASSMSGMLPSLVFFAAALYFCGVPLYAPTIPTMLLRCVPSHQRGAVLGIDGAVNTVARVIAPLFVGEIYRTRGSTMAFTIAAISSFTSAAIALLRRFSVFKQEPKQRDMA